MWLNESEIEQATRTYRDHPVLGEVARALDSLKDATNRNSDGWPYYRKAGLAGSKLGAIIYAADTAYWRHEDYAPDEAEVRQALSNVKAFRTRHDWTFDITDAERRATATKRELAARQAREARIEALAGKFAPELDSYAFAVRHGDKRSHLVASRTLEVARKLAEIAIG